MSGERTAFCVPVKPAFVQRHAAFDHPVAAFHVGGQGLCLFDEFDRIGALLDLVILLDHQDGVLDFFGARLKRRAIRRVLSQRISAGGRLGVKQQQIQTIQMAGMDARNSELLHGIESGRGLHVACHQHADQERHADGQVKMGAGAQSILPL